MPDTNNGNQIQKPTPIKVKCPYCGYEMPIKYTPKAAVCFGVFVRCKGRQCKREFEIKIDVR